MGRFEGLAIMATLFMAVLAAPAMGRSLEEVAEGPNAAPPKATLCKGFTKRCLDVAFQNLAKDKVINNAACCKLIVDKGEHCWDQTVNYLYSHGGSYLGFIYQWGHEVWGHCVDINT